jgi:hypothetical protein
MNFLEDILIPYCQESEYKFFEYSGRNSAKDCIGIEIPSGYVFKMISELIGTINGFADLEQDDYDNLFGELEDYINDIELDSFGRDSQVVYNRNWKWVDVEDILRKDEQNGEE